jgi:hypothetical protein
MKIILVAILTCFSAACTPRPPIIIDNGSESAKKFIEVDERLMAYCNKLPDFNSENPSAKDVLQQKSLDVKAYAVCASRHKELSDLIRKYWKVPETK